MLHSTKTGEDIQVNWIHYRHYLVLPDTVSAFRYCWICGKQFFAGESVSVCGTTGGRKLVHSDCYDRQLTYEPEDVVDDYFERMAQEPLDKPAEKAYNIEDAGECVNGRKSPEAR
jgi:hypothetical protein